MQSWTHDEPTGFAYVTYDGEVILFSELVREVQDALRLAGFEIEVWQLSCAIQAVRQIAREGGGAGTLEGLEQRVERSLARRSIILGPALLRTALATYLKQLQRFDIARVQHF